MGSRRSSRRQLDRLELGVIPLVLGAGVPLFPPGTPETALCLVASRATTAGGLHLVYDRA